VQADLHLWGLLAVAAATTYALRLGGVLAAGRLNPAGDAIRWVNAIATAIAVGLGVRVTLWPAGALADTPLAWRLAALGCAYLVLFAFRRNLFLALAAGVATLALLLAWRPDGP